MFVWLWDILTCSVKCSTKTNTIAAFPFSGSTCSMASLTSTTLPNHNKPFTSPKAKNIPSTVTLLQMCRNLEEVRQVHAQFVVSGLLHHPLNPGRLIESYVALSHTQHALSLFDSIPSPDVFAYNTVMRGLLMAKDPFASLLVCNKLLLNGLKPDNYTYTFVLKACSQLRALSQGKQVHCLIIKAGKEPDDFVHSSLIHMYSSSGSVACAERVLSEFTQENTLAKNAMISGYLSQGLVDKAKAMFDKMVGKDVASWSAMVTGFTENGRFVEALSLLRAMMASRVSPNESTLVSSLCACAHLGALEQGRWINAYVDKVLGKMSITIGTALIHMYAKCGCIESSYQVFRKLPNKDVVTYGAIISGFSIHGKPEACFQIFGEMVSEGLRPNAIIFVAILSACSHSGQVDLGLGYFRQMVDEFGIVPSIEHYGCMVDLLGRAGRLAEAEELIMAMPMKPNLVIWGSFLNACRTHNDPIRGSVAFRHLTELEPMSGDRYKLAGLMYCNAGHKENAKRIRQFVEENSLETTRGVSFIEIDGVVKEFVAGSVVDHHISKQVYRMWEGASMFESQL